MELSFISLLQNHMDGPEYLAAPPKRHAAWLPTSVVT